MGSFLHFVRNFESKTMPIYLTISEFLSSELEHFDTFKYSRALFDSFGTIGSLLGILWPVQDRLREV